jgi:hypothetical protein
MKINAKLRLDLVIGKGVTGGDSFSYDANCFE